MTGFLGFPAATRKFLRALAKNNNRAWFAENKARYDADVLEPALAFIEAMRGPIESVSPHFLAVASRSGGSLMRVHRDTRFARDKAPYKTNIGIQFRHVAGKDVHAPGFYVHIEAGNAFLAAGLWHPDAAPLAAIRAAIAADPAGWQRARNGKAFREHFALAGTSLKRAPRGFDPDTPMIEDIKRKDFIAVCELDPASVEDPAFVKRTHAAFRAGGGFMRYLCKAVGVAF